MVAIPESASLSGLPPADFIFGTTPAMQEVRLETERALSDDLPVLIEGENGTGKEVVARYLHLRSSLATAPFVRVNCGAMPGRLLEGEIFGSDKIKGRGSIEMAAGGTLFLDDIADMDLVVQQRLLQHFRVRIDELEASKDDRDRRVRVVCASTIEVESTAGRRPRLCGELISGFGHRVYLLPLRERKQDIPRLCEHLIDRFARNFTRPAPSLSRYVLDAFQQWEWPGNIRELENWIARIVIFGTEDAIGLEFMRQIGAARGVGRRGHRVIRMSAARTGRRRRS